MIEFEVKERIMSIGEKKDKPCITLLPKPCSV